MWPDSDREVDRDPRLLVAEQRFHPGVVRRTREAIRFDELGEDLDPVGTVLLGRQSGQERRGRPNGAPGTGRGAGTVPLRPDGWAQLPTALSCYPGTG